MRRVSLPWRKLYKEEPPDWLNAQTSGRKRRRQMYRHAMTSPAASTEMYPRPSRTQTEDVLCKGRGSVYKGGYMQGARGREGRGGEQKGETRGRGSNDYIGNLDSRHVLHFLILECVHRLHCIL